MHLRTIFQFDKSKFAWVRQFWKNSQKIQNLKKFECFNRLWPNSIPKFLDGCNIFVCSFRTIARILRKLDVPRPFFKKFKIVTVQVATASQAYQISYRYLKPFMSYRGFKRWKSDTYTHAHTHTHTHTSRRQLKITFLDVWHYSEYSDTDISKKTFFTKTASSLTKQN